MEVAQVTRVFFAEAAVTTRLRHWLCGAQIPSKRTNGWRGGGTNAARRARNCTGVMSRTWSVSLIRSMARRSSMQALQRFAQPLLWRGGGELAPLPELRDHGVDIRRTKAQLAQPRSHLRGDIERARG
jgi:hypothetical protein